MHRGSGQQKTSPESKILPSPTFRLNDVAIQAANRMSVSSQKPGRMIARTNAHNYEKNAVTVNYAS
jgi:hypothetical protein